MMEKVQSWKETTAALYKAVLIFTWSGIALTIVSGIANMVGMADGLSSLASGDFSGGFGVWDILEIIVSLAILYGYWLFIRSLGIFSEQVDPSDAGPVKSIRAATIVQIVATVVALIPVLGMVGVILSIVAWIMLLIAYSRLKDSTTFPQLAREGARKVYLAMLLGLIGAVVAIIPILGWIAAPVLALVSFFLVLSGWKRISLSEAPQK